MVIDQMYQAILNGDCDLNYFTALLVERERAQYVQGYQDATQDADEIRNQFLQECG